MSDLKRKLKTIDKKHSKGVGICTSALAEAEEIFKDIEGFEHCQSGQDGSIEVIVRQKNFRFGNETEIDYSLTQALELLKEQGK